MKEPEIEDDVETIQTKTGSKTDSGEKGPNGLNEYAQQGRKDK